MVAARKKRWKVLNEFVKEIASTMKQSKTKAYDTVAKVLRVDEKTAYVHIDGGADETPAQMAINCRTGDTVKIRVSGGKAWITGNITAPPTDDSVAIKANKTATKVKKSYENFKDITEENFSSQEDKISEAAKVATNFMKYEDGTGLIVGDMRGDTLNQNTLLDSSGIAVRNGNNEIVRFGTGKIVIPNGIGEIQYNGNGSIVSSKDNIVVSTQQTKNSSDTNVGGKSALEMYYDSDSDVIGLALSIKKGTSYSDLYESEGRGLLMEYGIYDSGPEADVSLLGDNTRVDGTNTFVSGDKYLRLESDGEIHCQAPGLDFKLGKNNILWNANNVGYWMNAGHKFTLDQPISEQLTGAVFVWSHYDTSKHSVDNWWWMSFFVPKQHVAWRPADGMLMSNPYFGLNKYIYIHDTYIQGTDTNQSNTVQNGIAVKNKDFVLRYVLGV